MPDDSSAATDRKSRGRPRDWHDKTAQNTIKSLDRAMEVLEHLSERGDSTLTELSDGLGQAPASVYRVLITLEQRQIVDFDPNTQFWNIGPTAYLIGTRFLRRTSLVERARPIMRHLMEATGETANLGIERGGQVLFVSQVETHATIRAFFPPGTQSAMHASGIGKALLAVMPAETRTQILDTHPLDQYTPNTAPNRAALEAELVLTAERGWSFDAEEKNIGMRCIAAPVFDVHGEPVAGISVSGPTSRITDDVIGTHSEAVVKAARNLTQAIGGRAS